MEKKAVIGDTHIPYQDNHAIGVMLNFLKDFQPNEIVLNGDMIDAAQLSTKFDRDPSFTDTIYEDIEVTKQWLANLRNMFGKAHIHYNWGNHESRLRKYAWRICPELDKLLKLEELLELAKMKITYNIDETDVYRINENLIVTHGTVISKHSGMTARRMLEQKGISLIHNHSHRLGSVYKTLYGGFLGAWENGCLCSFKLARLWRQAYPPNWQHGFSVVFTKGSRFDVKPIFISKGKLLFGEREWKE